MSWMKELEKNIDKEDSTYTDWKYLINVIEWLADADCLNKEGLKFMLYIDKKFSIPEGQTQHKKEAKK